MKTNEIEIKEGTKTSFVCSLFGLIFAWLITPVGLVLSIIGLCLLKTSEPKFRTASMVLGVSGIVSCVISWILAFMMVFILYLI